PMHFLQALVLLSIVTATVMQAIGDSVARGLGMLGALAVIRFRTTLRNPRNIVFMFASLAAGIACGVYGFVIAIVGTIGFCFTAFALRFTPFSRKNNLVGILKFEMLDNADKLEEIQKVMEAHSFRFALKRYKTFNPKPPKVVSPLPTEDTVEGETPPPVVVAKPVIPKGELVEYEYKLKMKKAEEGIQFVRALRELPDVFNIRFNIQDTFEEV
ncbi:MAG: DUF4956 domain-containing protein, partial [Bacteroidota bacterium]